MQIREASRLFHGQEVREGAGVKLTRVFGGQELPLFDPFLLLDDFSSDRSEDYAAGFPWHPHRGIETVTYILSGEVAHQDSIGNDGSIGAGSVQWMSAGRGIIHQEMPQERPQGIRGFQLWVNLPKAEKLAPPRYRDILAGSIPEAVASGARVKVIAGAYADVAGPSADIAGAPTYLDVSLEKGAAFEYPVAVDNTVLIYVFEGRIAAGTMRTPVPAKSLAVLGAGDLVHIESPDAPSRLLLLSGTPLKEPVAWHGPIVMNTESEIRAALSDLRNGTFINPD